MATFHYPSPCTRARDEFYFLFLLTTTAHMGLIVACQQILGHRSRVAGGIRAQMPWLLFGWFRTTDDQTIEGGTEQAHVMALGCFHDRGERNPGSISQPTPLGCRLPRSVGLVPVGAPAKGAFVSTPSTACPLDAQRVKKGYVVAIWPTSTMKADRSQR